MYLEHYPPNGMPTSLKIKENSRIRLYDVVMEFNWILQLQIPTRCVAMF